MYASNHSVSRVLRGPALALLLALLLAFTARSAAAGDLTGQTLTLRSGTLGSGGASLLEHSSPTGELHVAGAAIGQPLPVWFSESPSGLRLVAGFSAATAVSDLLRDDSDGDEVPTLRDNCPDIANALQVSTNAGEDDDPTTPGIQQYGNVCDPDLDNDGDVDGLDRLMQLACFRGDTFPNFDCADADLVGGSLTSDPDPSNVQVDGLDRLQMLRWFRKAGSRPGRQP